MNKLDKDYLALCQDILDNGTKKETRNGGTISVFGRQIRHSMKDGFPLLTTKKMAFKTMVTELLWFLKGDTSIKFLVDNGCNIWTGDAYKNYLRKVIRDKDIVRYLKSYSIDTKGVPTIEPYSKDEFIERIKNDDVFAKKWGELGPIYGKQWRSWGTGETVTVGHNGQHTLLGEKVVDQIETLIRDLKTNPDSRRLMVSAWNVAELDSMTLPPCHYGFQVYTRELSLEERRKLVGNKTLLLLGSQEDSYDEANIPRRAISLMFNMRSTDVGLGLPFNLASYGLLLLMIAKEVNMTPDELIYNGGDVHIYTNHIEPIKEQLNRAPFPLPEVIINDEFWNPDIGIFDQIHYIQVDDFILENYNSNLSIKMPLSN